MKRLILSILLGLLLTPALYAAAVTSDAYTVGSCGTWAAGNCTGTPTALTISHTSAADANAMTVLAFLDTASGCTTPTVASMQYAGSQNLSSSVTPVSSNARNRAEAWSLAAGTSPTTGANNLVVTLSANIDTACAANNLLYVIVITGKGVNATTLFTSISTGSGSGVTAALTPTLTSGANDLVIFGACGGSTFSANTGTQKWNSDNTLADCLSQRGAENAGGTTNPTATLGSDSWLAIGFSWKEAAGGTPAVSRMSLLGVGP